MGRKNVGIRSKCDHRRCKFLQYQSYVETRRMLRRRFFLSPWLLFTMSRSKFRNHTPKKSKSRIKSLTKHHGQHIPYNKQSTEATNTRTLSPCNRIIDKAQFLLCEMMNEEKPKSENKRREQRTDGRQFTHDWSMAGN